MCRKHSAWALAGMLLTLTIGSPVWADDVELLLSTPASSEAAKPNILFILDSSYSMTTLETTQEPYDPNEYYTGPCNNSMYYWTTSGSIPSCGSNYRFWRSSFHCDQGRVQATASGSYTDTMAMYYSYSGKAKWREPYYTLKSSPVECKEDEAVHGENGTSNRKYARRGTNKGSKWTNNSNRKVNWGDSPTHRIITVYDSNYLNWYYNPPGSSMSRTDIVKQVTKNVLGSINNVNVGFMHFNWDQGGPVVFALKDLDDNRSDADDVVDNLPADGWTPLSETLYEAALYWRGLDAYYGDEDDTDDDALDSTSPMNYKQPVEYACSKNFQVMLTDGDPRRDVDAYTRVPDLPGYTAATGRSSCTGSSGTNGACLDDIAEYLFKTDINTTVPGQQNVTTYTIGFSDDLALETTQLLKDTAELGGGEYYIASDVATLSAALTDIVTDVFDRDISFTAPALAVNAFNRTQHLNDLYVSVFRAADEMHWPGNLKKYTLKDSEIQDKLEQNAVDPGTGFFHQDAHNFWNETSEADGLNVGAGGAANLLPDPATRNVYTNNSWGDLTDPFNSLSTGNISAFSDGIFGLSGAAGEPTEAQLIDWARGVDYADEDGDGETVDDDPRYVMGDTLHSQPAAVVYGDTGGSQQIVVFTATNDGYLHAFDADTGEEMWAFIPRELLPNLKELFFNLNVDYKNYGLDGDIVPIVADVNEDGIITIGTDFVYLVFGMRRGGDNYYLLDVSDPDEPHLKWIKTLPEFGQSWSRPTPARVDIDSNLVTSSQNGVLILGGGYDTAHDTEAHPDEPDAEGAGIFMLDLETGVELWRAGPDTGAELTRTQMTRSIPSQIKVIDMSGDGYADRMYAADLGGQLWRFDITNGEVPDDLVAGGVIARLGAEGLGSPTVADTRRFYTAPDVAMFVDKHQDRRYLSLSIGSGYRAHPLNNNTTDRFYSIRDGDVFNPLTQQQYNDYDIITDGSLIDVQGQLGTSIPSNSAGWKLTLPPNEKILSESRTFNDYIYFVSFEPEVSSSEPCEAGKSVNRLYRVSVQNGDPKLDYEAPVPTDPEDIDEERVTKLEQGGIAPVPVFLFPSGTDNSCTGAECQPPEPIGCVGVECFDPEFPNNPVRTLWTQDGID